MTLPPVISDLFQSKKFVFTMLLTVGLILAMRFDLLPQAQVMTILGVLWPVYVGSQGVADVGAKIAAGHVEREKIYAAMQAKKDEHVSSVLSQGMPLLLQALQSIPGSPPRYGSPMPSVEGRPLSKGDKVILLSMGPAELGDVLEDQEGSQALVKFPSWKEAKKTERSLLAYVDPRYYDEVLRHAKTVPSSPSS